MSTKKVILIEEAEQPQGDNEGWGDAWKDCRQPLPSIITEWIGDCRVLLRRALCGRERQEIAGRAATAARNAGKAITEAQEEEIGRRLARGDRVREIVCAWRAAKPRLTEEEHACHPFRLLHLVDLSLLPAPSIDVRTAIRRLRVQEGKRGPIDLDQRMREADDLVASGGMG